MSLDHRGRHDDIVVTLSLFAPTQEGGLAFGYVGGLRYFQVEGGTYGTDILIQTHFSDEIWANVIKTTHLCFEANDSVKRVPCCVGIESCGSSQVWVGSLFALIVKQLLHVVYGSASLGGR